jgi:ethanolamine utilization protein EutP (predicted NTPase)
LLLLLLLLLIDHETLLYMGPYIHDNNRRGPHQAGAGQQRRQIGHVTRAQLPSLHPIDEIAELLTLTRNNSRFQVRTAAC